MKKYIFLSSALLVAVIMSGCGRHVYYNIESNKMFGMPSTNVNYEFIPIKATGKETITKGTDKFIDKSNFEVSYSTQADTKSVSISKGGIQVTVAHSSFNFLRDKYGLYDGIKHPLSGKYYPILHLWYGTPVHYTIDNHQIYQIYSIVPFNQCIMEMYRSNNNKILLDTFNRAFTEGSIQPYLGDQKTTQEIKSMMEERVIGQPYCSSYLKRNVVFYVKVENLGIEKIRLWPIQQSVVIDSTNTQYKSLNKEIVDNILSKWKSKLNSIPQGRNNPQIGLHLSKKPADKQPYQGYTVYENGMIVRAVDAHMPGAIAGILVGDLIKKIDQVPVNSEEDIAKSLSTKVPGDRITVTLGRNGKVIITPLKLMSADDLPRPPDIRLLAGGDVYPSVVYDGFLVFDMSAMLYTYREGSTIKLIIPLIGTSFDAGDRPIRSFEYEFEFKLDKN